MPTQKIILLTCIEEAPTMSPLLWRWWTAAKVLSIDVTVVLPVQGRVSLSILPQTVGRQDSTSCPSTSCYSGPFYMASAGESGREGRKGGTTLGTPFPSDPSPYYHLDCKSETKQQQKLISCGFTLCAYYVYWKDHYTGWTTCTCCSQPLTLQLVGRDLSLLFKHSTGYIRMNHSSHNTS